MKRLVDILIASVGLIFVWPVIVVCILAVRLTSEGRGIFSQSRVGLNEEEFKCLKIRTMVRGTEQAGTHEVSEASITSVGKWLRATKIDELPQLLNVIKGEMSLVGPRPCLPIQKELINERGNCGVFLVRPGITGLAQVCGIDMSNPKLLAQYDAVYINQKNMILYGMIIVLTVVPKSFGMHTKFKQRFTVQ